MHKLTKVGIGVVGAITLTAAPAFADLAPSGSDVVGVGSDTVQNIQNFLADGDTGGDGGYNSSGNLNREFSFDATPDANDRAGYLNGSTSASLKPLNPTVVLRAGKNPVPRPNGSGSGIAALIADTGHQIDFVRSSRPAKASEDSNAAFGTAGLRTVQISTDDLAIAVANAATNAPAALSAAQLVSIYKCTATTWTAVGGTSTNTIVPLIPQNGSGTRSTFLADLQAANGGTAITPGSCVQTVEENDPLSITGATAPADTIAPFSGGRINLYDTGYFHTPNGTFPGGAALSSGVHLLTGTTASDSNPNYLDTRALYIIFRASDAASTTIFQPGGTKNWAQELFIRKGSSKSFAESANATADIAAGGATAAYVDKGAHFTVG